MPDATPGASQIFNPPPPATPEAAAARLEELKADPAFKERVSKADAAAFDEWTRTWRLARGMTAEPQPPQDVPAVMAAMTERQIAEAESHAAFLRGRGLSDVQIHQLQGGRPQPIEERRVHEAERQRMLRDKDWQRRWREGDAEAIRQETLNAYGLRMPIGSVADCEAWDRANPFPRR